MVLSCIEGMGGVWRGMVAFALFPGDSVVLIALLGIAVGGLGGRLAGGIRVGFFLAALVLGLALGGMLGKVGVFHTLTGLLGFDVPLWHLLIPKLLATVLIMVIVIAALEPVHHKIYLHYKYKYKDGLDYGEFDTWEYLNDIWGLTLGTAAGMVATTLLLSWLYVPGYLLMQVRPAKAVVERVEPTGHRLLRRVASDMHSLKLAGVAAALGPGTERFYAASDTVGMIYHNYARENLYERDRFHQRVFYYPAISELLRHEEFRKLQGNTNLIKQISDNSNIMSIILDGSVAPLLRATCLPPNEDDNATSAPPTWAKQLQELDLVDYQRFLREGRSEVFQADAPGQAAVLGTWQLDVDETYKAMRNHPAYAQAREPDHLAVLRFLRSAAFIQYGGEQPLRVYDWTLTFKANKEFYSMGRFFPTGPLFAARNQVYHFEDPPIGNQAAMWAGGIWSPPSGGTNAYTANLNIFAQPPLATTVAIEPFNKHLIITFPQAFNGEKYVFRRYEF